MKRHIKLIVAAAALAMPAAASAQSTYSGYFLDNYMYTFGMNPAMVNMGDKGFVGMPVLGNMNIGMQGNLHVSDILYNYNGKTVLFANPNIPASEVLNNLGNNNKVGVFTKLDLITVGFKAFGGQNIVSLSAVADANVGVPKSLFSLIKEGVSNQTYNIDDVRANATGYAQLQFNHQRDLSKWVPGLKAGAAFKLLFGIANLDAQLDRLSLDLGEDRWIGQSQANMWMNMGKSAYKLKHNDDTNRDYVNGLDINGLGVSGFGIAFDLGATYKWRDFDFSLALTDLGFISWSGTKLATTDGVQEINTSDYIFQIKGDDDDKDAWEKLKDDASMLYQLSDKGDVGTRTRALRATLNWGVRYTLPYYRNLTFGMVNTTRFNSMFTTTDFRFSANVQPVKCFSASANFVAGTYGVGFGWLANVNITGFNLFIGMDHTLGKLAKQGLPLNSNAQVNFGINFPF